MNFRRNIILSRFFSLQSEKRFSPRPAPVISDRHMQKYLPHTRVSADRQSFPELHREESESIRPASFPFAVFSEISASAGDAKNALPAPVCLLYYIASDLSTPPRQQKTPRHFCPRRPLSAADRSASVQDKCRKISSRHLSVFY